MKIQVLFFGIAADLVGTSSLITEVPSGATVYDFKIKIKLQAEFSKLSEINSYAIAVNESYSSDNVTLKENDVVAIIPPVSGG